eukprot:TRINITY_DN9134_c0_g2_i1.p1 TRINITY_DN9134_c0_g2~~TRINITY_DN9134_c0_g2_i1.p1  ORF type:complete len:537 (-),score=84.33 TRINITY_DN9134_c0_g2_i1:123-1733(-)
MISSVRTAATSTNNTSAVGRFAGDILVSFQSLFQSSRKIGGITSSRWEGCLILAAMGVTLLFDLHQLIFMISGAVFYLCLQKLQPRTDLKVRPQLSSKPANAAAMCMDYHDGAGTAERKLTPRPWPVTRVVRPYRPPAQPVLPTHEVRTATRKPIEPPVFKGVGWEEEVGELLINIMPSPESRAAVERVGECVRAGLQHLYPGLEIVGFAAGDFRRGTAFGVAVPEIDIAVNIKPQVLLNQFTRFSRSVNRVSQLDILKVQKGALRECTEALVSSSNFKFRRSAFQSTEPKVTLMAPMGKGEQSVAIDLSINASVPLRNMALLTECERIEPRSRELIVLVRRWTKDRGICHAIKGYLSPYLWSILTIYFLQVRVEEEGPLLPPLEQFDMTVGLSGKLELATSRPRRSLPPCVGQRTSTAALFKEFVRFYCTQFDWRHEAVSICHGKRSAPSTKLPLHVIEVDGAIQKTEVSITIEDPFMKTRNLGKCMNSISFARTRQELKRANELCSREASLRDLLELWAPPEEMKLSPDDKVVQ